MTCAQHVVPHPSKCGVFLRASPIGRSVVMANTPQGPLGRPPCFSRRPRNRGGAACEGQYSRRVETQPGESGGLRRRGTASAARHRDESASRSASTDIRLIPGFDVSVACARGFLVTDLALRKAQSRYLGAYAWELGVDPHDLCPLCGEIFGGWCLHADHVMPEHYNALYQDGDQWRPARDAGELPPGTEVYHAVQCAAYAHAPCNLQKGRSADIASWRLAGFEPLIVAESDLGKAVAVPGPVVVPAEPRTPQQRAAETLGVHHSKAGSGSTRGRRLGIEERNREATLAQETLSIYDRLAAVRRRHRDATEDDSAVPSNSPSSRAHAREKGGPAHATIEAQIVRRCAPVTAHTGGAGAAISRQGPPTVSSPSTVPPRRSTCFLVDPRLQLRRFPSPQDGSLRQSLGFAAPSSAS